MVLLGHHDGNRGGLDRHLWINTKPRLLLRPSATAIWCHHPHPACLHTIRLPVHTYTHTALSVRVGIAKHGCHLRFARHRTFGLGVPLPWQGIALKRFCSNFLDSPHVLSRWWWKVTQALLDMFPTLQEWAVETYNGTYTQGRHLTRPWCNVSRRRLPPCLRPM